jgi:trigger factor
MEFAVNEVEYCKVSVHAEADLEKIVSKRTEVLAEFKGVNVPGFRPGKASLDAIKIRYKKQIENRLREVLAEEAFIGVLNDRNMKALGMPEFSMLNLTDSKFTCEFTMRVKPTVVLNKYRDFEIPRPAEPISISQFSEKILQDLRERNGDSVPFTDDDFVQVGDSILLDYEGTIDGVARKDLTAKKEVVHVGKSPLPGFDDNLLGMKMGDVREFDYVTPPNVSEEFKGKTIHFKAEVCMGSRTTPAALDDELAKRLNMKDLDDLRTHVAQVATTRVDEHRNSLVSVQVSHRLVEGHDIPIPDWLLSSEAQIKSKMAKKEWDKLTDEEKESFLNEAKKSIKLSLVLEKIREVEPEAQLSDEEAFQLVRFHLAQMQARNGKSGDVEKAFQDLQKSGSLPVLLGRIRDERVLNWLVTTCKLVDHINHEHSHEHKDHGHTGHEGHTHE